uniref:C2H2-type domain-containing protein n=1 Tax=Anopheles christyi TaxID=43041 RepID=A0A182JXM8_9DIPT
MDAVFSFPVLYKAELPNDVCNGCFSTVRNFFSYTLKVQEIQSYLAPKWDSTAKKSTIANSYPCTTSSCDTLDDSFEPYAYRKEYLEEGKSMDAIMSSTWKESPALMSDPLLDVSNVQLAIDSKTSFSECDTTDSFYSTKRLRSREIKCIMDSSLHSDLPYTCSECDLKLATKLQLYKHRRVHRKKECPVCNLLFRADKIKGHFARKHPHHKLLLARDEFRCENCQELFHIEAQLHRHLYPKQMQDCPVCEKPSTTMHIEKHLASLDTGQNELVDSDGESNSFKPKTDAAKVKTERVYYCTKRYKCGKCEQKFFDKVNHAKHQRLHRTVECPMCNKIFRTDHIKKHIAARHPNNDGTKKELYRCTDCKKLFANELQFALHSRTHKKEVCPVCKETATSTHIKNHLNLLKNNDLSDDIDDIPHNLSQVDVTITEN